MATYGGSNVVTDGLILSVDAANPKSYTSGSTTWRDLSSNGKNGTLSGGTGYSNAFGGSLTFDGVNDTVNFGTGNTFFPSNNLTIEMTFQSKGTVPVTGTIPSLFGFTFGVRLNFSSATNINFITNSGSSTAFELLSNDGINYRDNGNWYNLVCQVTPTNMFMYVNGVLKNSRNSTWLGTTVWPTNGWNVGRDNNNSNNFFTGSIASYKMYNRALSASEIAQNYNAIKSRFSL